MIRILLTFLSLTFIASLLPQTGEAQFPFENLPGLERPADEEDDDDGERRRPLLLPPGIAMNLTGFMKSLEANQMQLLEPARQALSGLSRGQDLDALKLFDELRAAGLTEDQQNLLADARIAIDTYLLGKNFGEIPEFRGPLQDIMTAYKDGELKELPTLFAGLKDLATLSEEQEDLLEELIRQAQSWYS